MPARLSQWRQGLHGLWPSGLVVALLLTWAAWAAVILTHPLHPTRAGALASDSFGSSVGQWAFVEPQNQHLDILPMLQDPVVAHWRIAGTPSTPTADSPDQHGWVAWKDELGTHVAHLDGSGVNIRVGNDHEAGTARDATSGRMTVTLPAAYRVSDVTHLWNGNRLLGPTWLVPMLTFALAVALLWREPRFRTRWGWFWILGAPLGIGIVWMLLREQWFGARPGPERRPGGWNGFFTSFLLSIVASVLLSGLVPQS